MDCGLRIYVGETRCDRPYGRNANKENHHIIKRYTQKEFSSNFKSVFLILILLTLMLFFAHSAQGVIREVGPGKTYSTIQSAIGDAGTGDTVLVYDGTYTERIDFLGKAITVRSVNGAASTIIDGSAGGSVVTFNQGEGAGSVLNGFTIRNGSYTAGGGIYCYISCSPVITNCTIAGNLAVLGGGIGCYNSSPTEKNSILWGDTATSSGNEIYLNSSPITVTYSDVQGGWAGTGNINTDPLFVGWVNLHLQPGSPCVNQGTATGAPEYDFEGNSRLASVGGDNLPDMGADELAKNKLLWKNTSMAACLWALDSADILLSMKSYGPFTNWEPISYERSIDGTGRLLWKNTSGEACLWTLDPSDSYVSLKSYGPFPGWQPIDYDRSSDGSVKLLWKDTSNAACIWTLDTTDAYVSYTTYGPYANWAPINGHR